MSKVERGPNEPPPKASCNYFFFEASRVIVESRKLITIQQQSFAARVLVA